MAAHRLEITMHQPPNGPDHLTRALVRMLLLAVAVSWTLSAAATHSAVASPCGDEPGLRAARWRPQRPSYCDYLTGIGVDFLNDQAPYPDPHGPAVGEVYANRLAVFKIYALTDDPRFYADITHEIKALKFEARSPRGSAPVKGKFIYTSTSNEPLVYFIPVDEAPDDRVVFLQISCHCWQPKSVYRTQFTLTVRGTHTKRGSEPRLESGDSIPPEVETAAPQPQEPGDGQCTDLAVSVTGPTEPVRQGDPFTTVVTVKNVGTTVSEQSEIVLSAIRAISMAATHGSAYTGYWRDRRLSYFPGRLEPGAEATLTIVGHSWYSGTITLPATVSPGWGDCNPANDYAEAKFVVVPTIPDLTAAWTTSKLVFSQDWPRGERVNARGTIRVSNDGQADAGPTRLMAFLSKDPFAGPEDRFLGFWNVSPIPAGGAATVVLHRELRQFNAEGPWRLLAVVDSSNAVYELQEGNNDALSLPVR